MRGSVEGRRALLRRWSISLPRPTAGYIDGFRSQIVRDDGGVQIFTRRGVDRTANYRHLAKVARDLEVESAIIAARSSP